LFSWYFGVDAERAWFIEATLDLVRSLSWRSCLITMSPTFFAAECKAWGFDFVYGSEFAKRPHPYAVGAPLKILCPEDKVEIVKRPCIECGTTLADSIAFGDSVSDLFLFERIGFSVAVNASAAMRAKARFSYDGADLLEAFADTLTRIGRGDRSARRNKPAEQTFKHRRDFRE
jgi:phosphoserine phosphatase